MLAADLSNYTSPLTADALAKWKSDGVDLVIVQAIDPPIGYPAGRTRDQIQACSAAGLDVDAYVWLWFGLDVADIRRKLSLLDGLTIRKLWLDVEDTAAVKYDDATCQAKVSAALAACDAYATTSATPTGIYTGRWFWTDQRYMANTTAFADRELWDAAYDGQQTTDGFVSYGGWQSRALHQYAGTSTLEGIGDVDLDVLSADVEAAVLAPRETPADWQWPTWREAAINLKAIADQLGSQLQAAQSTTDPAV